MKKKRNKTIAVGLVVTTAVIVAITSTTFFLSQKEQKLNSSKPFTSKNHEVTFNPSSIKGEYGEEFSVDVIFDSGRDIVDQIEFASIKLAYDPSILEIINISQGKAPGVYQTSIIVDDSNSPVGLLNLLWVPQELSSGSNSDTPIGEVTFRLLSTDQQSIGVTPIGVSDTVIGSIITEKNGESKALNSKGLSINGGTYIHEEWLDSDLHTCSEACTDEEICLGVECVKLASTVFTPPGNVLGAATDGMLTCSEDSDCVKVSTTCCDCEQGGKEVSINKNFQEQYEIDLDCSEGTYVCLNQNLCRSSVAACQNNLCTISEGKVLGSSTHPIYNEGDIDKNGVVDLLDYSMFLADKIICEKEILCEERSDLNGDGHVSTADFLIFMSLFESVKSGN